MSNLWLDVVSTRRILNVSMLTDCFHASDLLFICFIIVMVEYFLAITLIGYLTHIFIVHIVAADSLIDMCAVFTF
jgi:hypothetical protein